MKLSLIMCCLLLIPLAASAQWTGFPFRVNTASNTYDSFQLIQDYRPFHQINSALVERCSVAGIAAPTNIQYWAGLWAGTNQSIVTQVVGVVTNIYTNWVTLTTNAWTTNVIGGFAYNYTDYSGAHTTTGYTYLTHDYLVAVDSKIQALCAAGFIVTNYESFLTNRYDFGLGALKPPEWSDLKESFANILQREGIGYVTNSTSNQWNVILAGTANFTQSPPTTNRFVLAQAANTNGSAWDFRLIKTNDANMYDTSTPMVQYFPAGTNAFSAFNILITGQVLRVASSQTLASTSEVVSVSTSGAACIGKWWSVSGITCTATPPNTGDCVEVVYTNTRAVYSEWPWDLSDIARDLDERQKVINALQWTYNACSNSSGKWYNPEQRVFRSTDGWSTLLSQYTAFYATSATNWVDFTTNKNPSARASVETIHYGVNNDTFSIFGGDAGGGVKENNYGTYFASSISTAAAHSAVLYGKDKVTLTVPPPFANLNLLGFAPHPTDFTSLSYPYYQQVNGLTMNTNSAIVSSNYFIVPFTNLFNIYTSTPETLAARSHGDSFTWVLKWTFDYK